MLAVLVSVRFGGYFVQIAVLWGHTGVWSREMSATQRL